jgi:TetR/AcrR family transcriptional repressor of mexJK operon
VIGARTERVVGQFPDAQVPDVHHPAAALHAIGEQFLVLMRDENVLGQFRALYGAAGAQQEACEAFYRQGADRLVQDLANYLGLAHKAGTLRVPHPEQAADIFLAMFLGTGHIRGLLKLSTPSRQQDQALLTEAVRVFMAAYGT